MSEAHRAGTAALKEAREEFRRKKQEGKDSGKPFIQPGPREYGGKICRHCDPETGEVTYYSTQTEGTWPLQIDNPDIAGTVDPQSAPDCNDGDKLMALWHTHPGKWDGLNDTFGQGGEITPGDKSVADGLIGTDPDTGELRRFTNMNNRKGVPLSMTRDDGTGTGNTETFAYQFGEYAHFEEGCDCENEETYP